MTRPSRTRLSVLLMITGAFFRCEQPKVAHENPIALNKQTDNTQKIHFRTYGNEAFVKSKKRIINEANSTGWFATAKAMGPEDLPISFREDYAGILALPRGGGYWVWKFYVFEEAMSTIHEGDFLVWLDAGCQINKGGAERFHQYVRILNESHYDVLAFKLKPRYPEFRWTTQRLFYAFGVEANVSITNTPQFQSGTIILQKGPHFRQWIEMVKNVLGNDPWMITDKYNNDPMNSPFFVENRHDQSIMSISWKKIGCISISYEETKFSQEDKPFHVMRLKE